MEFLGYNRSIRFTRKKAIMQSVDAKDQRIKQLEIENQKLQEKIDKLEQNIEALTQAVLHASKQLWCFQ